MNEVNNDAQDEDFEILLNEATADYMEDDESVDFLPDPFRQAEIPDGYFRCPCCRHIYSCDDQDNPDIQGLFCNDCYYTGKCCEPDDTETELDECND